MTPTRQDDSTALEVRVALESLPAIPGALTRAMGALGIAGNSMEPLLSGCMEAECATCGILIRGPELLATAIAGELAGDSKAGRLRLGYCARKGCDSRYYIIRFCRADGVNWSAAWTRAEAILSGRDADPPEPDAPTGPPAPARPSLLRSPALCASVAAGALLTGMFAMRSGCRIPGLTPGGEVFIVPEIATGAAMDAAGVE